MVIKKISLFNYRNYKILNLDLHDKINIICGKNGQGKTNILESIYVLGLTKSHRSILDDNLIRYTEVNSKIKGIITTDNEFDKKLEINISKNGKKYYIDDELIKKNYEYISSMNVVIFSPEDLNLIKGSPAERRKYINLQISQLNKNYYKLINDYNKILKMRNDYLKNNYNFNHSYFSIITDYLIDKASYIIYFRNKYINKINKIIGDIYNEIIGIQNFKIIYKTFIDNLSNIDEIKQKLNEVYNKCRNEEIENRITIIGPHHDDFYFFVENNDLKKYGSQGQQRCAIIALKLSEIKIIDNVKGNKPILLLDDVFSELDFTKKNNILNFLSDDIQVIITTTDVDNIDKNIVNKSKIFEIDNAEIINIKEVE